MSREGGGASGVSGRAVAAWTAACLLIVLMTTNPAYKALVLAAALCALVAGAGARRLKTLLLAVAILASFSTVLNFVSAHIGATVLFSLPAGIPGIGGPFTLEALVYGVVGGITIAAAVLAAAPFSVMLASHDVVDAMPRWLSSTGSAVAASMNLVPALATP